MLEEAGITDSVIETSSALTLDPNSLSIIRTHLTTSISGTGDCTKIQELAQQAKSGCSVSKLLNADISMGATVT